MFTFNPFYFLALAVLNVIFSLLGYSIFYSIFSVCFAFPAALILSVFWPKAWDEKLSTPMKLAISASAMLAVMAIASDEFIAIYIPIVLIIGKILPDKWNIAVNLKKNIVISFLSIACIFSVLFFNWPLKLEFVLLKPHLNKIASEYKSGELKTPRRIGLVKVIGVEKFNGVLCVWTQHEYTGYTGFVNASNEDSLPNPFSAYTLSKDWTFVTQD